MTATYVSAEERRRQLVAAARVVIQRDGMARASLRAVAAEAGVLLGTVQYVFPTKEQLLRAVLEDVVAGIATAIKAAAPKAKDLERAMLESALPVWTAIVEGDPGEQIMQYELAIWALRTPEMSSLARWQYETYLDLITTNWTKAAERAGVSLSVPVAHLARLFLASLDGLILQYLTLRNPEDARSDLEAVIRQLVRYAAPHQPTKPVRTRR